MTPTPKQTARKDRRERFRREFAIDRASLDVTQEEAAEAIGVSKTDMQRYCSRTENRSLPAFDIPALPEMLALSTLRRLVDQINENIGGRRYALAEICPIEPMQSGAIGLLGRLAKEYGEAASMYAEINANDSWNSATFAAFDKEISDLISVSVSVRESMRARVKQLTGAR